MPYVLRAVSTSSTTSSFTLVSVSYVDALMAGMVQPPPHSVHREFSYQRCCWTDATSIGAIVGFASDPDSKLSTSSAPCQSYAWILTGSWSSVLPVRDLLDLAHWDRTKLLRRAPVGTGYLLDFLLFRDPTMGSNHASHCWLGHATLVDDEVTSSMHGHVKGP
ncbi:hypothetical protein LTR17_025558 [Elasticomyces elasticus]|nr:hypothetical protein LTR17_025558 [Elasticomyces elasticus]